MFAAGANGDMLRFRNGLSPVVPPAGGHEPERERKREREMQPPGSERDAIMRYSFLVAFANDGTLDADELAFIKRLALRDGIVDDGERTVLSRIFARVSAETVTPDVWRDIEAFKQEHQIP
jgi:hypothetical protein